MVATALGHELFEYLEHGGLSRSGPPRQDDAANSVFVRAVAEMAILSESVHNVPLVERRIVIDGATKAQVGHSLT